MKVAPQCYHECSIVQFHMCFTAFLIFFVGELASEHCNHGKLYEQVQQDIFFPAAAKAYGLDIKGCLVSFKTYW